MGAIYVLSACVLLCVLAIRLLVDSKRRKRLPPGPRGIPIFGNAFDIPKKCEWLTYARWSREYDSDIIYLNLMGTPMVVLHSTEAATDLFEKRSSLYSDRPSGVMAQELVGWDFLVAFMQYGGRWRDSRRAFHQHFTANAVLQYYPKATAGTRKLLARLLDTPDDFMAHIRLMTGELIMHIVYGIDVTSRDDPYISVAETAVKTLATGNAGAFLVDVFPILKYVPAWFPGAEFKRLAQMWRKDVRTMVEMPFNAVKQALLKGCATPSVLGTQLGKLDENKDNAYQEDIFRSAAGSAYAGGADTTVSSLGTFILAMMMYPEVQKKAQAELDSVVGRDRLPELEDEGSLPYITALVKEVFRWQSVTPLAVPHRLIADDEYKGYHLPAGTIVVGNAWAMLHDENKYPEPERFFPERFLDEDGALDPSVPDPEAAFGFGRRLCPGRHLARASVWTTIAHILATFDIRKALDDAGSEIEPSLEYTPGLVSYPVPFRCDLKPRSAEAERLVRFGGDGSDA